MDAAITDKDLIYFYFEMIKKSGASGGTGTDAGSYLEDVCKEGGPRETG